MAETESGMLFWATEVFYKASGCLSLEPVRVMCFAHSRWTKAWVVFWIAGFLAAFAGQATAQAPGVSVRPTDVALSPSHLTEMVRLRNDTSEAQRYQLSAYAWEQTSDGRQVLHPTDDLIFFPPLFTVKSGDEQIIRVASGVPFSLKEKSCRLFIEQLPPLTKPSGEQGPRVRLLMRMGLPVFLQPGNVVDGAELDAAEVRGSTLRFTLKDTGNVHLVTSDLHVSGLGSDGRAVFERSARPSYVQADSSLNFILPVPSKDCFRIRTLSVSVKTEQQAPGRDFNLKRAKLTKSITLGPDSCGAAGKGVNMKATTTSS